MVWPDNPNILFVQVLDSETGPHYDNYEEYYRPYLVPENQGIIRFCHTNPLNPNTDGDLLSDPDDPWPLNFPHGGLDNNTNNSEQPNDQEQNDNENKESEKLSVIYVEPIIPLNDN